jgi:4-hydroxy-tetrahydrodipicolinate synthase
MVAAARARQWTRVHDLYSRFAALIVLEQQPGVAVRKEILRRRGVLASSRARHPGASISAPMAAQVETALTRTLPGVDITRPIAVDEVVAQP